MRSASWKFTVLGESSVRAQVIVAAGVPGRAFVFRREIVVGVRAVIGPLAQIVLLAQIADLLGMDRPIRLSAPCWQRYCT